ncbi:hypothetical protein FKM82_018973 [Ascaphus truei]
MSSGCFIVKNRPPLLTTNLNGKPHLYFTSFSRRKDVKGFSSLRRSTVILDRSLYSWIGSSLKVRGSISRLAVRSLSLVE